MTIDWKRLAEHNSALMSDALRERDEYKQAFLRYGNHLPGCVWLNDTGGERSEPYCSCEYDRVRKDVAEVRCPSCDSLGPDHSDDCALWIDYAAYDYLRMELGKARQSLERFQAAVEEAVNTVGYYKP